jgi:hypothetical protein
MERIYRVEVSGFNTTERILLGSVFGLSLRRSPSYRRAEAGESPHLRLVDGALSGAITQALERQTNEPLPVVLVGDGPPPEGWQHTQRPLHWARLFRAMDRSLGLLTHGPEADQVGARLALPLGVTAEAGTEPLSMQDAITASLAMAGESGQAALGPVASGAARPRTLLFVSEEAAAGSLPLAALRACGQPIEVVDSSARAMARLTRRQYALILVNLSLPGAQSLCRAVGTHPGPAVLPRLVYKVNASPFDRVRAAVMPCEAYVATGPGGEELAAAVLRLAGARGNGA